MSAMNIDKNELEECHRKNLELAWRRNKLEEYHRKNLKNMIVRDSSFYKEIVKAKENSEKLHAIGGEDPNTSGHYRAIVWVLKIIDEDTQKPEVGQ